MATKKAAKAAGLKIKLVKSLIGSNKGQVAVAQSLGLRRIGSETLQPDNGATRGKITKIAHLVEVSES